MADIEIVVKLSEKDVKSLKRLGVLWVESESGSSVVSKALLEGTILPKGHGDIVDMNALIDTFWDGNYMEIHKDDLSTIEPIVKADTEGREDNLERDCE